MQIDIGSLKVYINNNHVSDISNGEEIVDTGL